MNDITVLKLSPDEWQKYREIRLLALKSDPNAFGSSYEEEINLTESEWRKRIHAMWFAKSDGNIVGLIGLLQRENVASKHCGYIISLWVKKEFRGRGIAKSLIQKLKEISPNLGIRKLSLQVSTTQTGAKKIYQDLGFQEAGTLKQNLLKDGVYLDEYLMEWHVNEQ
jgi:ribosomal protein S18 acetylase RimI-like enzyme